MMEMSTMILRLFFAALMGAIVGFEREMTHKSAGLRTHMLVCMGACTFMLVSMADLSSMVDTSAALAAGRQINVNFDPSRIAAQIVTGIGFIGGGAVLREGSSIRGITTAASLWNMAAIGMLAGAGLYSLATFATLFSVLVLYTMGKLQYRRMNKHFKDKDELSLLVYVDEEQESHIARFIDKFLEDHIISMESKQMGDEADEGPGTTRLRYHVDIRGLLVNWSKWKQALKKQKGVRRVALRFNPNKQYPNE
jgi:putative Mg2+ transporter-C (MgtC) family protein